MFCSQNERTQELSRRKKPKRIRIGEEKEEIVHFDYLILLIYTPPSRSAFSGQACSAKRTLQTE